MKSAPESKIITQESIVYFADEEKLATAGMALSAMSSTEKGTVTFPKRRNASCRRRGEPVKPPGKKFRGFSEHVEAERHQERRGDDHGRTHGHILRDMPFSGAGDAIEFHNDVYSKKSRLFSIYIGKAGFCNSL